MGLFFFFKKNSFAFFPADATIKYVHTPVRELHTCRFGNGSVFGKGLPESTAQRVEAEQNSNRQEPAKVALNRHFDCLFIIFGRVDSLVDDIQCKGHMLKQVRRVILDHHRLYQYVIWDRCHSLVLMNF